MNSDEYINTLRELVEEGREVNLVVSGHSMTPFLVEKRDRIYFRKPDRELRRGDMVFYHRKTGQYVMHRIAKVDSKGFYMTGDAQTELEGPISREQIFGIVVRVIRKGKRIGPGNFWWEFFEHVWIRLIPVRPLLQKCYGLMSRRGNGR